MTIVIKSKTEYAETLRRVANRMPINRIEDITDLNEAAGILEDLATRERRKADKSAPIISEDET